MKFQPRGYNSPVTVSGFHLTQDNVRTADPVHTNFGAQTVQARSRSIELEVHASLTNNLELIANYTYTNLVKVRSNSAQGKSPVSIPRNVALCVDRLQAKARGLSGLQLRGGLRYDLGRRFPGMRGWLVSLKASNPLDWRFISWCNDDTYNWGQGPIVLAGLQYHW
ncbi:hypothetical protein DBA20_02565 [Pandoraea capi]|nr:MULTISPECIES: TonB-dependent receptor [Pandoraea]MCI3203845.1 hypothetical protein [Pandoraea sp. LA3]MDN4581871.1 hypothetical protein [Pandoraea capi]